MDVTMNYRALEASEYETFFSMMKEKTGTYLEPTLAAMGLDWSCLRDMVCAVGEVRAVDRQGVPVGFVWIAEARCCVIWRTNSRAKRTRSNWGFMTPITGRELCTNVWDSNLRRRETTLVF